MRIRFLILELAILFFARAVFGQELPISPTPKIDKAFLLVTGVQAAASTYDGITTKHLLARCLDCTEHGAVANFFLGDRPGYRRMALFGAIETSSTAFVAMKMRTSRHAWLRKIWWVPPLALAGWHIWDGRGNSDLCSKGC